MTARTRKSKQGGAGGKTATTPLQADYAHRTRSLAALQQEGRVLQARFDVAQSTPDNRRHWAQADAMSADAAYSPQVRKTIRERARLEWENNAVMRGVVMTYVNDLIASGPQLQLTMVGTPTRASKIERAWGRWARAVRLHEKLRVAKTARIVDGESIILLTYNPRIPGPIKLDLQVVECDRLSNPYGFSGLADHAGIQALVTDGIWFDQYGNPLRYSILRNHPGDLYGNTLENDWISADYVWHVYRRIRPEQHRGVSELAPCLQRLADLRRYTNAVIAAAETAADFAAVLQTNGMPDEFQGANPMETLELEKRMMTVLPEGYSLGQIKSEQPATTYEMFKRAMIDEVCRGLNIPYVIGAADASKSNLSSARMDQRGYIRQLKVEQADDDVFLDRVFMLAMMELSTTDGFKTLDWQNIEHTWMWEEPIESDPREATSVAKQLESGTISLADVTARRGRDWERVLEQRHRIEVRRAELEARLMQTRIRLGLLSPDGTPYTTGPSGAPPASKPMDNEDDEQDNTTKDGGDEDDL